MIQSDKTNINYSLPEDKIDLGELFGLLWGGKKLIVLITSIFALCSVLLALNLTNYYKSEAILSIAGGSAALSALSKYSGLASMAGINMPISGNDQGTLVVNTIKSRVFLKHLLSFENVMPSIMASKSYDMESKKLLLDPKIYDATNKVWLRKPNKGQQIKPSYLEAYKTYMDQVSISYDTAAGLMTISVEHMSPIFAQEFLDLIIREANELLRQKDLEKATDALEYLVSEIAQTSLIEIKSSINQLIQTQLETQMMAKISSDYVLRTIEPPFVPEKKSWPNKFMICVLGTILGGVLGILWVLMRHYALDVRKQ